MIIAITSPSVIAAIITAGVSLLVAILTAWFSRRNSIAVKKLEAAQAESNARISYNYEARKRLYTVCEPLLFQAMEQAEDARSRICSLAKSARNGQLRADGSGWLAMPQEFHEYYFKSTVYSLLAPITTFSILQRRLTTIDLSLDASVRAKYELLKLVFFSFSKDWDLASWGSEDTKLEYDRNKTDLGEPDREKLLRDSPERHAPQGLYRAMVYVVAEALIQDAGVSSKNQGGTEPVPRCMTFGEFQREWDNAQSERAPLARRTLGRLSHPPGPHSVMTPVLNSLVDLFGGFHPKRKPVLWRVLVTQYLLYRALPGDESMLTPLTEAEINSFDWRHHGAGDIDETLQPLGIAEGFVGEDLASLRKRLES
jgi:hypothetical protein